MDKVKRIIKVNLDRHKHFEEYFKIIDIIKEHELNNPDICIESCKALIEGISKTIIVNLDETQTSDNIDDDNLPKLFKKAMTLLAAESLEIEGDFVFRFSQIIQVLGEIRNKRGDISHGRMAPKVIYSSPKLASTFVHMTDCMLEYILEHYYKIDFDNKGMLDYNSNGMSVFNQWLDESIDFPIKKARYSKVLYENDYDEYENRFRNEFSPDIEEEVKEAVSRIIGSLLIWRAKRESKAEKKTPAETRKEQIVVPVQKKKVVEQEKKKIEKLVSDFDEKTFWTEIRNQALQEFANEENLKTKELKDVINEFLFSEKPPLRDDVAKTMNERPKLSEFKTLVPVLTEKIMAFANQLNNPEAEA